MAENPRLRSGVIKRGKKWAYVIRVTDASGVSKPRWVSGFNTEAEAKAARDKARVEANRGAFVERNDITVEQYLDLWLASHALEIKPKTIEDYRSLIARYVTPRIGDQRLQAIKPAMLSSFYATLLHGGGKDGAPLSPRTVNYVHSVLRKAFNDAVDVDQILPSNPALRAKRPRVTAVRSVHLMWGAPELRTFLNTVAEHRLHAFFRLASFTGARRGELLFLKWSSVHLDGDDPHIWISGSTSIVRGRRVDGPTKTGRERRVTIDPGTVAILKQHQSQQEQNRSVIGDGWPGGDYVFRMESGTRLRTDLPGEVMRAAIRNTNRHDQVLQPIRLHDLRHVHATLLLQAGVPVHVVADRLGHVDAAMTLRVYAHVLKDQATSAAQSFARVMGESGGPTEARVSKSVSKTVQRGMSTPGQQSADQGLWLPR